MLLYNHSGPDHAYFFFFLTLWGQAVFGFVMFGLQRLYVPKEDLDSFLVMGNGVEGPIVWVLMVDMNIWGEFLRSGE